MSCYLSHVYYRFNTFPEESICVGMILLDSDSGKSIARLSDIKLKIASKILPNKSVFKLFKESAIKLVNHDEISYEFLDWMHRYQNGVIKVTEPRIIACQLDRFDSLFEKTIESNFKKENNE